MKPKPTSEQTVISVRVDKQVKEEAQAVAQSMGLGLSSLINGFLLQIIETRRFEFVAPPEQMTKKLERSLKKSEKDRRKGKMSPVFETAQEGIDYLNNLK